MTKEEIINALQDDKMMPFIQPDQLAKIVDFVSENHQPSLPEGLDEAAEEYEKERLSDYGYRGEWSGAFIAGAEWRDAQGVNYELEVKADAGGYPYIDKTFELYDYTADKPVFNPGDKVIVNIRKKEDKK